MIALADDPTPKVIAFLSSPPPPYTLLLTAVFILHKMLFYLLPPQPPPPRPPPPPPSFNLCWDAETFHLIFEMLLYVQKYTHTYENNFLLTHALYASHSKLPR